MGEKGDEPADEHENIRLKLLCLRLHARALHVGNGLHAQPVSEERLQHAEERLGFRLPPLLRRLYTTVANGAEFFAPSEIFYGISDDHPRRPGIQGTIDEFQGEGERLDEATVTALQAHPGAYVTCDAVPEHFVELSVSGGVGIWLDGLTGRLFASDNVLGQDGEVTVGFSFWASSVDEWLERELAADPFRNDGSRQPLMPLARLTAETDTQARRAALAQAKNTQESSRLEDNVIPEGLRAWLEHQQLEQEAKQLRLERQSQRLRLARRKVVRLLNEVADIQHTVMAEVGETQSPPTEWGDPVLQSLADAEAQLYEMERLLDGGLM